MGGGKFDVHGISLVVQTISETLVIGSNEPSSCVGKSKARAVERVEKFNLTLHYTSLEIDV
jgi:hypothetical protein